MWEEIECENCSGDGEIICDRCGGTGSLPGFATFGGGFTSCDVCLGSGYVECTECDGNGYTEEWVADEEEDKYWIEERNERQEKEKQRQQEILKLREFVFNLKTQMEDIYQSNELSVEKKYLQSRDICQSLAINYLNPNNFETFDDKDYAVSVKRYLFNTRDELFESLGNDKKSITKILESKEKKLKEMLNRNIEKPNAPTAPNLDKSRLRKRLEKPIKPKNYFAGLKNKVEEEKRQIILFLSGIFFVVALTAIVAAISRPFLINARGILTGSNWDLFGFITMGTTFFGFFVLFSWMNQYDNNQKKVREEFNKYEGLLSVYLRNEEYNEMVLYEYEKKLQDYKQNDEIVLQNYQGKLQKYQNNQDNIKALEQEIASLYQSFNLVGSNSPTFKVVSFRL